MRNVLLVLICVVLFLFGCGDKEAVERLAQQNTQLKEENRALKQELEVGAGKLDFLAAKLGGVKARIVTNFGEIEVRLFPEKATIHCFNFVTRAESGFYDNTQFHRVIPGFMIQGGDPNTKDDDPYNDGAGGPLVTIPPEFNDTHHRRGILSMARVSDKSVGAGCQFFVVHKDSHHLNREYTAFGEVTKGMEVVDRIAAVETHKEDPRLVNHPVKPVVIQRVQVYR